MSNYPDASSAAKAKGLGAVKKPAPTLNDDGRQGGASYVQNGKSASGADFIGPEAHGANVMMAKEVVDPNESVDQLFDNSSGHTSDE